MAPLVGMMPDGALPTLPSRHLGLVTAEQSNLSGEHFDQLAAACGQYLDIPAIVELAQSTEGFAVKEPATSDAALPRRVRLGIARDEAFHFYYADNLEALERDGVEWVPFSPLRDARLPADLDGLYFGGGYPEVFAAQLADNAEMLAAVRRFAAAGGTIYAECGGLMYLGQSLTVLDGASHPLAGVLPIHTAMLPRLKVLGYAEVAWAGDSLWGTAGQVARGHEFHYSEIRHSDTGVKESWCDGWRPAYSVARRRGEAVAAGFCRGRIVAGYVHLHWASRPDAVRHFVSCCEQHS
jgi:cobyrinic acid a,c-diamide synthase